MEILLSGLRYKELPDTYVIFICDFDPFGKGKYRYTQEKMCKEDPEIDMTDGTHIIFLSTKGNNENDISPELVKLLKYIGTPLSDSEQDFEDEFVRKLQDSVAQVKVSREMGARYMTFEELLNEEKEEERLEIAESMLERNMSLEDIIACTRLTEEQILGIAKATKAE